MDLLTELTHARARRLRRLRGHLEGAEHAAHAADVAPPTRSTASSLLGGILLIGEVDGFLDKFLLVIAIAFGTINVVGGFLVTDRMLEMFKRPSRLSDDA